MPPDRWDPRPDGYCVAQICLSPNERVELAQTIDDLVRDTPRTSLAATRFNKLMAKAGRVAGQVLLKTVVEIAPATARSHLGV